MALSTERDTKRRDGRDLTLKAVAGKVYYAGALVAVDAGGRATPGATATTLRGLGRVRETVDNSAGLDDDLEVPIERGVFHFANAAADPVSLADVGATCYIVDDETVARTDGGSTRSVAGKVFDVDANGVWVDFRV